MTTGRPNTTQSVPRWLYLSAAVVVALGIFFRFYNLDRKTFWEDEILGAIHANGYTEREVAAASPGLTHASDVRRYFEPEGSRGVRAAISSIATEDPQHPPPYYVVANLWTQRFGGSVAAQRTPAAIFGVLVLPLVFLLALELFGSRSTAIVAVALAAVSPFFVLYSQEAREYSLWTAAIALDGYVFLRAVRSQAPAVVPWIVYGAVTAAALWIYPLTLLVALGLAAYLLIRERARLTRTMLGGLLATAGAFAVFAPWAKTMATSAGLERGMGAIFSSKLPPLMVVRIFARDIRLAFFDIGFAHLGPLGHSALDAVLTLAAITLCAYAFVALIRSTPYSVWGFVVLGLCLSMMPLVLRDLFVHGNIVYQARYFLPLLLGALLAVAALFGRLLFGGTAAGAARTAGALVLIGVFAGEVFSCAVASQATTWWNKDYERAPAVAALVDDANDPIVVSDYFTPSILELSLYLNPATPMRLNLKCAMCAPYPYAEVPLETGGHRSVFEVRAADAGASAEQGWIDPAPYPPQERPLNMFASVLPGR